MVFKRQVEGDITKAEKCKIAVYSCPVDVIQTETKVKFCTRFKIVHIRMCLIDQLE